MPNAVETPRPRVVLAAGAHKSLVGIGLGLAVLAILVACFGRVVGTTVEKNGNKTTTKGWPSDTEFTALLSSGAVLILTGFLWSRISAIKLPGGAEIDLSGDEQADAAKEVAKKMGDDANPQKVAEETQRAVSALRREKARAALPTASTVARLSTEDIARVVDDVVDTS